MDVRFVAGIIAAGLFFGGYWFMGNPGLGPLFGDGGNRVEAMDKDLQAQGARIYAALKTEFPQDYQKLLEGLVEKERTSASVSETVNFTQTFMADLRQRNGANLMRAAPEDLNGILDLSRDLHLRIRGGEGRVVCNGFATSGPPALASRIEAYVTEIDGQGAALIQAMANAKARAGEAAVPAATAEDWEAAIAQIEVNSDGPDHRAALTQMSPDADICAALVALIDTILGMDTEMGARLRATYVRDLAVN